MTARLPRLCLTPVALVTALACAHGNAARSTVAERSNAIPPQRNALIRYRLPGEFSVLLPPGVKREEKKTAIANREVDVHLAEAAPPGAAQTYLVSVADVPPEVLRSANPAAILQGVQEATVRQLGGELTGSRDIVAEGMPGREFSAHKPGEGNVMARVLVGNDAVYTLVGTYLASAPPDVILRFLNSFSRAGSAASTGAPPGPSPSGLTTIK